MFIFAAPAQAGLVVVPSTDQVCSTIVTHDDLCPPPCLSVEEPPWEGFPNITYNVDACVSLHLMDFIDEDLFRDLRAALAADAPGDASE